MDSLLIAVGDTVEREVMYVYATEPIYCYQHTAAGRDYSTTSPTSPGRHEISAALIPSMFSISQNVIAFVAADTSSFAYPSERGGDNTIFLVFQEGCESAFTIRIDDTSYGYDPDDPDASLVPLPNDSLFRITTVDPKDIPFPLSGAGVVTGEAAKWKYAIVTLPKAAAKNLVTISNDQSDFSLGYFNNGRATAAYGYLSGYGPWEFDPDTIWRCPGTTNTILTGGYCLSYDWTLPDGSHQNTSSITATKPGMYILDMNRDRTHAIGTCWVLDLTFDPKITYSDWIETYDSQIFDVKVQGTAGSHLVELEWTFEGGKPSSSTLQNPTVQWNTSGTKQVTLHLVAEAFDGIYGVRCDTTVVFEIYVHQTPFETALIKRLIELPAFEGVRSSPPPGRHYVNSRQDYTIEFVPVSRNYSLENIAVTSGSVYQDVLGGMLLVRNADGTVSVTFRYVLEPLLVNLTGVLYVDIPDANADIDKNAIWSNENRMYVRTAQAGVLKVYTLIGQLYKQQEVVAGETSIPLPKGMYFVTLNDEVRQKIVIK
jgi:hypothetical protein